MEKFIPYEKLSKKEKRKIDQARRQTWGELNPVTRKPENSRAYNRKRTQDWKTTESCVFSFVVFVIRPICVLNPCTLVFYIFQEYFPSS